MDAEGKNQSEGSESPLSACTMPRWSGAAVMLRRQTAENLVWSSVSADDAFDCEVQRNRRRIVAVVGQVFQAQAYL